jgi:hypothetical protein
MNEARLTTKMTYHNGWLLFVTELEKIAFCNKLKITRALHNLLKIKINCKK